MNKIGILGSGIVAQVLGNGFLKFGYEVKCGTRHPEKLQAWKDQAGPNGSVGTFEEAAAFGELVVLAVKGPGAENALKLAGGSNLAGKTVIDPTNPIEEVMPEDGVLRYFSDINYSLMEQLQEAFPDVHFVKAFNSISNTRMVQPDYDGIKPSMFICGNNEEAKKEVSLILDQFGFETEDMGSAVAARAIEPLCMLYCIPGFREHQWSHAFKLLK